MGVKEKDRYIGRDLRRVREKDKIKESETKRDWKKKKK